VTTKVWEELTFDEMQSPVHNWMRCLAWVIEDRGEHIIESTRNGFLACGDLKIKSVGSFLDTLYIAKWTAQRQILLFLKRLTGQ
jgi:hypothetical protein